MDGKTQRGHLIIADISGYTSYVARTELEHSQEVLTELLELILAHLTPALALSKLEGDAVFVYAPESRLSRGETLLELIESTYVAFKDRVEAVRRRTTCDCNACRAIPSLDLKFIAHCGDYIPQRVAGIHELAGSDVNLVHRLCKNHVGQATGWRAYALFTEQSLAQLGVPGEGMHRQVEEYEHLGAVTTYSFDLLRRYRELVAQRRVFLEPDEADATLVNECSAPPPIVWDWLNDPEKRALWEHKDIRPQKRRAGRTAPGASNHCHHGRNAVTVETVLDWRPFEYYTVEQVGARGMGITLTYHLIPARESTQLVVHAKMKPALPRLLHRAVGGLMVKMFKIDQDYQRIARLIAEANSSSDRRLPDVSASPAPQA